MWGHTIDGDGVLAADCPEDVICDVGVDNLAGHERLVVVGGTVRQFGVGVFVAGGAADNHLTYLVASDNTDFGIIVAESTDTVIAKTSMSDNGTSGVILADSRDALVASNSVSGSHGYAMNFCGVDDSNIRGNRLDGNGHGIQMTAASSRNTIRRNAVSDSGGSSIDIGGEGVYSNRVEHSRLTDNGDGIVLGNTSDTLLSHNTVTGTGFFGFPDTGGFGIILDGAKRTTVDRSVATGDRWSTAPQLNGRRLGCG